MTAEWRMGIGGVRVLQRGRRALILEVDNRAKEIAADTGLPTAQRGEEELIADWIANPKPVSIQMPWEAIEAWRGQFAQVEAA